MHHPDWREPLFLLASSLGEQESAKLVSHVLKAKSPYERELHRDLNLAGALVGQGYGVTDAIKARVVRQTGWLVSKWRERLRVTVLWFPFFLGLALPFALLPWWDAILFDVAWSILWFVALFSPPLEGLFRWPSRMIGGSGTHERVALTIQFPRYGAVAVPALLQALQGGESDVRRSAAEALGKIGDTAAVPALLQTLQDEDSWLREAVEALGKIGDTAAMPALIQTLQDEDPWLREAAAEALGEIGNEVAVPALLQALQDEDEDVRRSAARALGEIGSEAAVPALVEALQNRNEDARRSAARALGVN